MLPDYGSYLFPIHFLNFAFSWERNIFLCLYPTYKFLSNASITLKLPLKNCADVELETNAGHHTCAGHIYVLNNYIFYKIMVPVLKVTP
jgi:hypothetical protein